MSVLLPSSVCLVFSRLNESVFTCSVGLVNHRLHYSPPGIDEPGRQNDTMKTNITVVNKTIRIIVDSLVSVQCQ